MNTVNRTIDMRPYLPAAAVSRKAKMSLRDILAIIGMVIEGIVTVSIGFCLLGGICIFLTIV